MRVTMLVRCLAMMRGGGETRHLAWARELKALGVTVDIVTGRPLFGKPRHSIDSASVTMIRSPYARDFVYRRQQQRGFGRLTMAALHADEEWFCRAVWRRIAAGAVKPDIVHAHALHQAARLRTIDAPVVINLPGEPHPRYTRDLRSADALVADGWAADHLPAVLGCGVERIPKGVDSEQFRPDGSNVREELRLTSGQVVITVARLVPIKNVALLVDAFALLRDRVPAAHLLIVGDGPEAEALRNRVLVRGVANAVTFIGSVPQADTPKLYRSADVFALSSDFDNSPNALLEAMACRLPIVATNVGGVREFVTDSRGGAIVPPRDPRAMAGALERYLTSPDAARGAGAHNRQRAATEFSWRVSARRLLDVYDRVLAARPGRRASA